MIVNNVTVSYEIVEIVATVYDSDRQVL